MRKIIVEENNKRIITYIKSRFPSVSENAIYKALRQKDIRVNNIKTSDNISVNIGDEITIFIKDDILLGPNIALKSEMIIYNDDNIIIINKPKGILVQGTENEIGLDKLLNNYLNTSSVVPCHRLDRNTSGLIIFAKNTESEKIILDLIKKHEIVKHYFCLVYGHPNFKSTILKAFLFKDRKENRVIISDEKKKGYVEIITKCTVISSNSDNTSKLDVELITGRTHQIRAHLAYLGYPIIGDGKYGVNKINKQFRKSWQELESYKITFNNSYGKLEYLKGKSFEIR